MGLNVADLSLPEQQGELGVRTDPGGRADAVIYLMHIFIDHNEVLQ